MRPANYWHRRAEAFGSYRDSLLADAELLHFHLLDDLVGALRELSTPASRRSRSPRRLHRDEWRVIGDILTGRTYAGCVSSIGRKLGALDSGTVAS